MLDLPHFPYLLDGAPRMGEQKPLLLFLHGKGERGTNPQALRAHGPTQLFPRHGLDRFTLLSPQCPPDRDKWDPVKLQEFLDAYCRSSRVDPKRIYLTGLSLGGEGGWHLLSRCPERFAAALLICGRVEAMPEVEKVARAKRPIWLVHSAGDAAVPVSCSDKLFDALRAANADVTYTRYATLGHVPTWQETYGGPLVFDWLLRYRSE